MTIFDPARRAMSRRAMLQHMAAASAALAHESTALIFHARAVMASAGGAYLSGPAMHVRVSDRAFGASEATASRSVRGTPPDPPSF